MMMSNPNGFGKEVRTLLIQSVRELLYNVIRHANVDKAYISMSRSDDQVELIISDNGDGFDPSSLDKSNSEEDAFGLYHVQERMVALGGSIDIASEPGKGTEVTLRVPLIEEEELESTTDREEPISPTSELTKEKIRVLLVDDHKMMREGLSKIVDAEEDMKVIGEASDGKEAVELARETNPDVIIMDVNLPKMNGIEATKKIKSILPAARIIGISVHDSVDVIQDMRNAGATAYLKKDEAYETLCETIRAEISASNEKKIDH
ncbi:MAG: response regulator [Fodinibius sp.]|nr:response regulator [Fodinibius sp.]